MDVPARRHIVRAAIREEHRKQALRNGVGLILELLDVVRARIEDGIVAARIDHRNGRPVTHAPHARDVGAHAGADGLVITGREHAAAGLHELRDRRLLRRGQSRGTESEEPDLVVVGPGDRRRRGREVEIARNRRGARPVSMRGGRRMPRARDDADEFRQSESARSKVEAGIRHHQNFLWARALQDDLGKPVALELSEVADQHGNLLSTVAMRSGRSRGERKRNPHHLLSRRAACRFAKLLPAARARARCIPGDVSRLTPRDIENSGPDRGTPVSGQLGLTGRLAGRIARSRRTGRHGRGRVARACRLGHAVPARTHHRRCRRGYAPVTTTRGGA